MDENEFKLLDEEVLEAFKGTKLVYLFRCGSSLHLQDGDFLEKSDIDYIAVLREIRVDWVNGLPRRVSPELDALRLGDVLKRFYWRVKLRGWKGHPIEISLYTENKFMEYLEARSPPKMYLLHDHKLLFGNKGRLAGFIKKYKPDIRTAVSEYNIFVKGEDVYKFLWPWRSVCLLRERGRWLRDKKEIRDWVTLVYGDSAICDKFLLERELKKLIH